MKAKTGNLFVLLIIGCLMMANFIGCADRGELESFFKTGKYRFLSPDKLVASPDESTTMPILEDIGPMDATTGPYPNAVRPTEVDVVFEDTDYVIGATDVLDISILDLYAEGLETLLRREVSESGYIDLPQLKNRIQAEGMTQYQLTAAIKRAYVADQILQQPVVASVTVVTRRQQTFSVTGACGRPGTYQFVRPDMRLWDALALAGGVTQPNIDYIYVIRQAPPTPKSEAGIDIPGPTSRPADQVRMRRRRQAAPQKRSDLEALGGLMGGPQPTAADQPRLVSSFAETGETPGGAVTPAPVAQPAEAPAETPPAANGDGNNGKLMRWVYRDGKWVQVSAEQAAATQPATAPAEPATAPGPVDPLTEPNGGVKPLEQMPAQPEAPQAPEVPATPSPAPEPQDQTDPFGWAAINGRDLVRVIAISRDKLEQGGYRENVVIRENDVIYIPPLEIGEFYMTGEVMRPGVYSLTGRKVTIKMALAAAGGIGPMGWPENSVLIRRIGDGQEQMIPVNVERIWRGQDPDMILKPDDLLAIGTHWSSQFLAVMRNAFRMTYGFGFIYDRNFADPLEATPTSARFKQL